uniref:PAS domain-containing protein n=1 Tax=Percolomonas cosmopolitus TaxID=63605 RepID=A0A7S1KM27_9EUKA|mmetsp:Transcript_1191/g.4103  ORF Transcript_1191/g.4103 Transcript_1191/m.4103 type:complete len:510 (+) Transcript_1191:78-1607(+)|eukprot:CAMPEP_0117442726 /NCGR_PEP_ID=MMETSP0759-20121206/4307_1 /TAXON_ID=63605 /ORGANISM="Percolomonas cosmopolitus, Strain WS" /LENGTH=509 /DNA_ID=CAMNT_0005234637 /DNA_START=13 /DNA_END=1542 /DNA_ORIENTATION=-
MTPSIPSAKAPKDGIPPPLQFETGRLEWLDKHDIMIWNVFPQQKAARHLNVSESTLKRRLKRYRIMWPRKSVRDKTLSSIKKLNLKLHALIDRIEEQDRQIHLMRRIEPKDSPLSTDSSRTPQHLPGATHLVQHTSPQHTTQHDTLRDSQQLPNASFTGAPPTNDANQSAFRFPTLPPHELDAKSATRSSAHPNTSPTELRSSASFPFPPHNNYHDTSSTGAIFGVSSSLTTTTTSTQPSNSTLKPSEHLSTSLVNLINVPYQTTTPLLPAETQPMYLKCHDSLLRAKFSLLSFMKQREAATTHNAEDESSLENDHNNANNSRNGRFLGDLALLANFIPDQLRNRPQVLMDRNGHIMACNKQFVKFTGISYEAFCKGVHLDHFLIPSQQKHELNQRIGHLIERLVNVSTLLTLQFVASFHVKGKGIVCTEAFVEKCDQNFWAFFFDEEDSSPDANLVVVNEKVLFPKRSVRKGLNRLSQLNEPKDHSVNQWFLVEGLTQLVSCINGEEK